MSGTIGNVPASEAGQGQRGVYIIPPVSRPLPSMDRVRVILDEETSRTLLDMGTAFIVGGRASHPDSGTRVALHLVPIDREMADQLCGILMGTHKVTKIRQRDDKGEG